MAYKQLSDGERYGIALMRKQGFAVAQIACALGRHRSTVYRELQRNRSAHDNCYRPSHAGEKTRARRSHSRRNQRYGPEDFHLVEHLLCEKLSPEQIVGRSRREGLRLMSHETIYLWIKADQERGGSLFRHLRGSRKQRRKRYGRSDSRGRLAGKRMIGERPPVVDERSRVGDWEADTVHGKDTAAVLTLVERKTGLLRLGKLARATADLTAQRTCELLHLDHVHTITADNGTEFHSYKQIEAGLDTTFYFANPHHAWERGTNENTNALIRQFLPKGTSLRNLSQEDCDRIAELLNNRPRRRLGYKTPNEVYYPNRLPRHFVASCGKP
ncbi:IS30 family transposase [Opitutaceae bacterium EW11]|nr:IS30 family transposase [Opitutaceae bacterium EW11]